MRHKRLNLCVLFLSGLCLTGLKAQETVPATGGNVAGNGGNINYTVGQVVYSSFENDEGILIQGVHQPYEVLVPDGFEVTEKKEQNFKVYPNPTSDYFIFKAGEDEINHLIIQLYDLNGRLLKSENVNNSEIKMTLNEYESSGYILKINNTETNEVRSIKILKK